VLAGMAGGHGGKLDAALTVELILSAKGYRRFMNGLLLGAAILIAPGVACLGQTNSSLAANLPTLTLKPPPEPALIALAIGPGTASSWPIKPLDAVTAGSAQKEVSSQAQESPPPSRVFPLPELTTHDLPSGQKDAGASPRWTGAAVVSDSLFAATDLKLHKSPVGNQEAIGLSGTTDPVSNQINVRWGRSDTAVFSRIEREGLLKVPQPVFRSDVAQKIASAFAPQIIHVGHVEIYSSIVNAIARRNPLCLLDPQFLNISF
jgi:hypothetical protein